MAVVIRPKNVFDRDIERLNHNRILSTCYLEQIFEQSANNIFNDGITFYTEIETKTDDTTSYKYQRVQNSDWEYINVPIADATPNIGGTGTDILNWNANLMPKYKETYLKGVSVNIPLSNYWIESDPSYSIKDNMYTGVLKNGNLVWVAEEHTGNLSYTFDTTGAYEIVTFVPFSANGTNYAVSFSWDIGVAEDTTRIIAYKKIDYLVGDNEYDTTSPLSPLKGNFVYSDKLSIETQTKADTDSKYLVGYVVGATNITQSNINDKIIEAAEINWSNSYGCGGLLDRSTVVGSGFVIYVFFTIHYIENFIIHRYLTSVNQTSLNVKEYIIKQQGKTTNDADFVVATNELLINETRAEENSSKRQIEELSDIIKENYQNGKVTMDLECSIDDYYDQSAYKYDETNNEYDYDIIVDKSKKIISKRGSDGLPMTFTNNDIVLPKRVVMAKSPQGDVYSHKEVDMVNGKQFRVVGVKVKYDGHITQELTLQEEKT